MGTMVPLLLIPILGPLVQEGTSQHLVCVHIYIYKHTYPTPYISINKERNIYIYIHIHLSIYIYVHPKARKVPLPGGTGKIARSQLY